MPAIPTKSSSVYHCDVCGRNVRVPSNQKGLEIMQRCIITAKCKGKLHPVLSASTINSTPTFPPEVAGIQDWTQRQVLFTYTQTINSSVWNVPHELSTNPIVEVFANQLDAAGKTTQVRVVPKAINIIDDNNLQVIFTSPVSGTVQCVALASKNTVNPTTTSAPVANVIQLTAKGQLTIAFLVDPLSITAVFNSSATPTAVSVTYATNASTVVSPWNGATVFINGKTYVTKNFNILSGAPSPNPFTTGEIANGSTLFFQEIVSTGQALLLLSSAPYASTDRIYDKYIDLINISTSTPQLFYNNDELYAQTSVLKSTYPPIIVVV